MSDVTARALRLLALLQSRSVWTGPELAAEMGVTTRTVRRDVDRLRRMGYPVLTSAGHGGGYQLGAGRALPPLLLSASEAVTVAVGLRLAAASGVDGLDEEALRALAALERILPAPVRAEAGAVTEALGVIARPGAGTSAAVLTALATAVRDRVRVRVDYVRADGERAERRLEPYRVLSVEGRWYLFAWDLDREDWRTFRLDRMGTVQVSTFTISERTAPDIEQAVHESITVGGYAAAATVRILAPAEEIAPRIPARAGTVTADGPGACLLRAGADDLHWIAMHLAWIGAPIEVIDPPELLEVITRLGAWAGGVRAAPGNGPADGAATAPS
ncbi:helix-turn-helix transcriptional regulator [Brachybacterium saurashtrense]|uniref:WYL domain-containing protein n=1 Tax=Brachybacterium saurashtrense TaxID=556288 RepID=A0A345YS54_9MICO|nr:WYL domain-containing protein [Brachybacterium saurashtrense]AXK46756.1 WYL domain-containing protein [Brachybacterium saurashtrense]RRR22471.1 WYL domain-containing protein [Brachybacterium saurashtrense]